MRVHARHHRANKAGSIGLQLSPVEAGVGGCLPAIGEQLQVVPNRVCSAGTLAVRSAGHIVEHWPVAARGANR